MVFSFNILIQACFRFYLLTKEDPNFVFFRFTFMGFVELDQNGTEISSREITSVRCLIHTLPSVKFWILFRWQFWVHCDSCRRILWWQTQLLNVILVPLHECSVGAHFFQILRLPFSFNWILISILLLRRVCSFVSVHCVDSLHSESIYCETLTVSDPSNNRVNVHPDNMKFTIKIQSWPFLPDSIGLRFVFHHFLRSITQIYIYICTLHSEAPDISFLFCWFDLI
jgi:hypothetical protein